VVLLVAVHIGVGPIAEAVDPGVADSEIVIGVVASLTGVNTEWGIAIKHGFELVAKEVNSAGGINGRKVRLIIEDDGWSPPKGVAATKKLIERDGVFALAGFVCGGCVIPSLDYLNNNKVPLLVTTSTSHKFVTPLRRYTFMMMLPADKMSDVLVDFVMNELKPKRVGILYGLDAFGQPLYDGTVAALKAHGVEPAAVGTFDVRDTDLNAHVLKFKQANVDLVIAHAFPGIMSTFLKQAHALKLNARVVTGFAGELPVLPQLVPKEAIIGFIGMISTVDVIKGPLLKPFIEKYKREYPEYSARPTNPSAADAQSYAAALVFMEGLRRAGRELTRDKFVEALETIRNFETGILPPITFSPTQHDGGRLAKFFTYDGNGEARLHNDRYYIWKAR
jgi:branched-chain amino acid transport system substrate-binding protein